MAHAEPHFPCYFVTKLNRLMARLVDQEISGQRHDPAPADILRTVGTPAAGVCKAGP